MFYSILFFKQEQRTDIPDCFKDLNPDQMFAPILKNKKEFELDDFFFTPLEGKESIVYRRTSCGNRKTTTCNRLDRVS